MNRKSYFFSYFYLYIVCQSGSHACYIVDMTIIIVTALWRQITTVVTSASHLMRVIFRGSAHQLCNMSISFKMRPPLQIWGPTHSACSAGAAPILKEHEVQSRSSFVDRVIVSFIWSNQKIKSNCTLVIHLDNE